MYAFRLLNSTEKNYTTTKREGLAMVYVLHEFKHHLLGNRFVFYVDHMTFVYLINKPQVSNIIASGYYYFWNMTSRLCISLIVFI